MPNSNESIDIDVSYDSMILHMHLMSILTVSNHVRMFICCVLTFVKGCERSRVTTYYVSFSNVSIIYTIRHFENLFGFCLWVVLGIEFKDFKERETENIDTFRIRRTSTSLYYDSLFTQSYTFCVLRERERDRKNVKNLRERFSKRERERAR